MRTSVALRRAGVAFYRGARLVVSKARRMADKIKTGAVFAARKFTRLLNRVRRSLLRMVREVGKNLVETYVDVIDAIRRSDAHRRVSRRFVHDLYSSALESDIAFAEAVEQTIFGEPLQEDIDRRAVFKAALMLEARKRIRGILHDFEEGYITAQEALAEFAEHVAPTLLVVRLGATDALEDLDDVDAQQQIQEFVAMFAETLNRQHAGTLATLQIELQMQELMEEIERAEQRAQFRRLLAATVLKMAAHEIVDEATIAERIQSVNSEDITALLAATSEYVRGELGTYDFLQSLVKRTAAIYAADAELGLAIASLARELVRKAYKQSHITHRERRDLMRALPRRPRETAVAEETAGEDRLQEAPADTPEDVLQQQTREKDEEETDEVDASEGVVYGLWQTNCTRVVDRNCEQCLALEALTHTEMIPISKLPTPGTSTPCQDRCACCVVPVEEREYHDAVRSYWENFALSRGLSLASVMTQFADDPATLARSVKETKRYAEAINKWFSQLAMDVSGEDEES